MLILMHITGLILGGIFFIVGLFVSTISIAMSIEKLRTSTSLSKELIPWGLINIVGIAIILLSLKCFDIGG